MTDFYPIEIKIASKNGWFTPAEAKSYYGRYSRDGVCIHWWGDGTGADNHDNIVNYMLGQAQAGVKSPNYVVSDNKITLMVNPDDVAWCQESGNATEISFECQPTLGDEGYKKVGWLKWQLEGRYNKRLAIHGHNFWFQTTCPGSLDLNRIESECNKWASGVYAPVPTPSPAPIPTPEPTPLVTYTKLPVPVTYVTNKDTHLWKFDISTWSAFTSIEVLPKGKDVVVYGVGHNNVLHADYYMTEYSFSKEIPNGFNHADLDIAPTPQPIPLPKQVQPPQEVPNAPIQQPAQTSAPVPAQPSNPSAETPQSTATGEPRTPSQDTQVVQTPKETPATSQTPQVVVSQSAKKSLWDHFVDFLREFFHA